MSYEINDAKLELTDRMEKCVQERNSEEALAISNILAEQGDDETASEFRQYHHQWEKEDNYHDEVNGN